MFWPIGFCLFGLFGLPREICSFRVSERARHLWYVWFFGTVCRNVAFGLWYFSFCFGTVSRNRAILLETLIACARSGCTSVFCIMCRYKYVTMLISICMYMYTDTRKVWCRPGQYRHTRHTQTKGVYSEGYRIYIYIYMSPEPLGCI